MEDLTEPLRHAVVKNGRGPVFLNREERSVTGKVELFRPGGCLSRTQGGF